MTKETKPTPKKKRRISPCPDEVHFMVCMASSIYYGLTTFYLFSVSYEHIKSHNLEVESLFSEPMINLKDSIQPLLSWLTNDIVCLMANSTLAKRASSSKNIFALRHHLVLLGFSALKSLVFVVNTLAVLGYHPADKSYQLLSAYGVGWFLASCMIMSNTWCLKPTAPPFEQEKMLPKGSNQNEPQSFVNTSHKDATANLVDLEDIVLKWAKLIFDTTKSKSEGKIKKKYISYNINWTKLFQESLEPEYNESGPQQTSAPMHEKVLFKTTFTNTTQREQEYSFKTERATRSSSTVIIEKGVCRGMEVSLKLKTPCEIVEANAGFHQEVMLNHIGENTQEEELNWGVDSTVRVPPGHETMAELVILEEQLRKDFVIQNRLSGKVLVTVTNLKENNSLITVLEGNIAEIIRSLDYASKGFSFEGNIVKYETKGSCIFRYGIEQKVRINEFPIRSSRGY